MTKVSHESHQVNHATTMGSVAQKTWEQQVAHGEKRAVKGPHADRMSVEEKARVVISADQTEKSLKKTPTKKRVEKDILIVAPKQMREEKIEKLAIVKSSDDIFMKYLTSHEESTIAILGRMAVLIAQADSTFRQTLWNQSTQTMQMTVAMAPILKDLVQGQWNEQANATDEDAAKDQGAGIGMMISGVVGIGLGGMRAYGEDAEEIAKEGEKAMVNEVDAAPNAAKAAEKDIAESVEKKAAIEPKAEPKESVTSKWSMKRVSKYLKNIMEGMSSSQMMGQAGIQLFNNAPHDRAKADHQRAAGAFDGNAKQTEGFQAWGNQVTERSNQGVNAADQNHASTIQTWKSVSDSLTNSLVSAWNKI